MIPDDEQQLADALDTALQYDVVLLSGGTSKGAGDLSYRVASRLGDPGIVAHGVALKPGKPICLAVSNGKPVVILPGFPTSAIFTFHEFVAPVIRAFAGLPPQRRQTVTATLPLRVNSERGRTEYLLVSLVQGDGAPSAYPMGKGSGSVTTFSGADGFITIDQHTEIVDAGSEVQVQLLGQGVEPADLVVIGSHCVGLDALVGRLMRDGLRAKVLYVGSMGGAKAALRGECDIASVHLMDPGTGDYNRHLLDDTVALVPGYRRMQGIVFREGDARFAGQERRGCGGRCAGRSGLRDGQPQCRQRHARAHRQVARHEQAAGPRRADQIAQRGGGRGAPGPRRLGRGHRHGGAPVRPGLHRAARRAATTSSCPRPGWNGRRCVRFASCLPTLRRASNSPGWDSGCSSEQRAFKRATRPARHLSRRSLLPACRTDVPVAHA